MCGIVGMIGQTRDDRWAETHRILSHLLLAAEARGRDATGFVARAASRGAASKGKTFIAKEAIPASKFVQRMPVWKALSRHRCSAVICHVRLATHGSPSNPLNNHPHRSGGLSLVHNGVLSSHAELVDKYCLRTVSECDSEVLLRIIERAKTIPIGLSLCLMERPGAIVVYDERRDVCWLGHDDSRPLWVCRMKNDRRLFFGSTSDILIEGIQEALKECAVFDFLMPLAPGHVFCAPADGSIGAVFEEPIRPLAEWT
jgi:asparagine synthetase B (glutamine-hydrolysing)